MSNVTPQPKIGFVSLGCPKNLVDSERILTELRTEGYDVVPSYDNADMVIVNTCGFIDSAVQESLEAIGEALKENGKVIVTGCLGAKEDQIREVHPKVLEITGPHSYEQVLEHVHHYAPKPKHNPFLSLVPEQGVKLTPRHYAYLKFPKAATIAAPSASSRQCAAIWSAVRLAKCWRKPNAWPTPASKSCW
jgi:ribosomal protein S12 methylthiotransferase